MSGLECSEISINGLDYSGRMDAEYYQKVYLQLEKQILSNENDEMGNQASFLIGPFGSAYDTSNYTDIPDYRYVRGQDVKPFVLNDIEPRYMEKDDYERLEKYALLPNDILVSVVGTLGNACIVTEKYLPAIFSCKSSVIRTKTINPYYLVCYLNSKYGHTLLIRNARGAIQQGLNLDDLKTLHIPLFSEQLQSSCERLLFLSNDILEQSKTLYYEAEKQLLSALNLDSFTPSKENTSIKSFSQVIRSERLDAEYYQKKYDDIELKIKEFEYSTLEKLCLLIDHGMQPPYVENGEMRVFSQKWIKDKGIDYSFIDETDEPRTSQEFALKNSTYICKKNDILHYSVGANIGYCHTYLSDIPMMPGSFITLIRADEKKVNPIYLGVVLNSIAGRMQSEKRKSGTAQPYVYPKDLKKFLIPILQESIQQEIAEKVRRSFALREQSKALLKAATRAVEIAIEQDEEAGMKCLRKKTM